MPSNFTKQIQKLPVGGYLNSGNGFAVGGSVNTLPTNVPSPFLNQDLPGDRMIVSESDALALSDTSVGILYGGLYTFVQTKTLSTAPFTRGLACFWDTAVANSLFQVTADESGSQGVAPFAGVLIATLTRGLCGWVLTAGRVYIRMAAVFTGIPTDGCPVFLAGNGAGEPGVFDVLDGGGNPSFSQVGAMIQRYIGFANGLPVAAGVATSVEIALGRVFRW